ncbi:MAG: TetR/AcrR family transcriptional regulator [Chitinophagaceae bacterium]|nr:MAG: TetR/AcrR family transcriptional regulator [Chitinophagaceae bacterium]
MFNFAPEINGKCIMEWSEKQLQILNVAEELFASKGFEGTSVRDIAQKAEVNVAMISYYFGSKEKLLQSLILNRTEQTGLILEGLSHDVKLSPWEKIDKVIDYYVDKILNERNFHAIMNRQISLVQDKKLTEILINVKKRNSSMISEIIHEGQRKKIFRHVNVALTIGTVMGTISQVSMSKPFYCSLLKLDAGDDISYYKKIRPQLKSHLKSLLRAHLSINN